MGAIFQHQIECIDDIGHAFVSDKSPKETDDRRLVGQFPTGAKFGRVPAHFRGRQKPLGIDAV